MACTLLVNFYYAHPVGHAIEALRYGLGYHRADPSLEIALVLNERTPAELTRLVPFVRATYTIGGAFDFVAGGDAGRALAHIPRDWDYVVDDARRVEPWQREQFSGMAACYDTCGDWFRAREARGFAGGEPPAYRHQRLELDVGEGSRERARRRLRPNGQPRIAVMPGGSSNVRAFYPSVASWKKMLRALVAKYPDARLCMVGKLARDGRTVTRFSRAEVEALLAAVPGTVDAFDLPLVEQLALVEACDVFFSPHTGFGMAALAVGTPWLTLSGNRWPEFFFNGVPFYSVLPDPRRFPCYTFLATREDPPLIEDADGEGVRSPSMSAARIDADLDRIVEAARLLIEGRLGFEQAMTDHFTRIERFFDGRTPPIFSLDNVHTDYVDPRSWRSPA